MNAIRSPGAAAAAHPEPGFQAILRLVAETYDIPADHLRTATGERAEGARACFVWLCDYLKTRGPLAAASFIGLPYQTAIEAIASVDQQRAANPALQAELEELALTLQTEAMAFERLRLHRTSDDTPGDIALRLLSSMRGAGLCGTEKLQQLAAAYIARVMRDDEEQDLHAQLQAELSAARAEVEQLRAALAQAHRESLRLAADTSHPLEAHLREWALRAMALERASGPAERAAREHYERASRALLTAAEPHFKLQRSFK